MRRAAAAVLLVAALAISGCSDDDSDDAPREEPGLVTSGDTGDTFLHGQVLDVGQPVEDAAVQLQLFPEKDKPKVGETVPTFPVDAEMDGGNFVVTLDPDDVPARYRAGRGIQNFEIRVFRGGQLATLWHGVMINVDGVWRTHTAEGDQLMRMDFDLGTDTLTVTSSDGTVSEEDLPGLAS